MHIKLSPFRSSPPEVFSMEDAPRNEENPQENTNTSAISTKLLCNFIKITPMDRYAPENSQHICRTLLPMNTSGGLILHVKRISKVLYYEKFLFTVIKRNSLAIKMDNNNNNNNESNKYPVIVSRSPRNAPRFSHWALLLWQNIYIYIYI